jgi:SAM-dependent methyltransferase
VLRNLFTLNIGAGEMTYGDIRLDIYRSGTINMLADAEFLPLKSDLFDIVYSRNVLEHLPNPLNALREMKRVCKNTGKIILTTDNASYWAFHLLGYHTTSPILKVPKLFMKSQRYGIVGTHRHYCLFTEAHLQNLFIRSGLKVTKIKFIDFGTVLPDFTSRLLRVIPFLRNLSFPLILVEGRPMRACTKNEPEDTQNEK